MTLWLLVALVIAWARRVLGYVPGDENDLPDEAINQMWEQGTPVTVSVRRTPYWIPSVTTSTALTNASITYSTSWTS